MAAALDTGVLLLNSDTAVSPGWYEKLLAAAASKPAVATVTPVSNCAGPFSILGGGRCSPLPRGMTVEEIATLVEAVSPACRPQTPTGHGYCMLISSAALREVGLFDESRFGVGYGEENDFCLRASAAGFIHLVDDTTFVFHEGGESFGRWLKPFRHWRAFRRLRRLHPKYQQALLEWFAEDPLAALRSRVAAELAARGNPR
jgi:GT2 family glycosyltransferase